MKNLFLKITFALALTTYLMSCGSTIKPDSTSGNTEASELSENLTPVLMEIKKYSAREKDCKAEDCTYIELQMPVLSGGNDAAIDKINDFINGQYHEAVKSRLAEPLGNAPLETMCASFIEGYELFMLEFPDSEQKWFMEMDGRKSLVEADYFTMILNQSEYLGGAHSASFTQITSFNISNGNMIDIVDRYGRAKLTKIAEGYFRENNKLTSDQDLNDAGFMFEDGKFVLPENMGLTAEGILMVYNAYEVASFAQGETRFVIPYSELTEGV